MAKIRILRTAPYSVDGKILSLQIGQEVNLPDSYAQALVGLKQAEYINPPAPPVVETELPPAPKPASRKRSS